MLLRITSYNVCYTKLLRGLGPGFRHQGPVILVDAVQPAGGGIGQPGHLGPAAIEVVAVALVVGAEDTDRRRGGEGLEQGLAFLQRRGNPQPLLV